MEENNNINETTNNSQNEIINDDSVKSKEETKEKVDSKKIKFKIPTKLWIIIAIVIGVAICGIFVVRNFVIKPEVNIITKTSIEEILEIDELSTLNYYYNAIAIKKDDNGNEQYRVAYEGHVTAGIDFDSITVDIDETDKKILITLPDAKILDCVVDPGTLDFIFANKKAETKTINTEGYKLAKEDLTNRTANDATILKVAKDNAVEAINALLDPWLKEADAQYTYEVR